LFGDARRGDASAFDQLAGRVRGRVRRWALALTRDEDDADDVAQLVLLRLHQRMHQFDGRSRFTSWLFRMTRNVTLSRLERDVRRARLLERGRREGRVEAPDDARGGAAGEGGVDRARLAELVRHYHRELRGRRREIFAMADLRGMRVQEIAEQLGVAPSTVRVSLMHARRAIRARMLAAHPALLDEYGTGGDA
jgi:RNA polymerase sigma-70 factor (ECF subfamily)